MQRTIIRLATLGLAALVTALIATGQEGPKGKGVPKAEPSKGATRPIPPAATPSSSLVPDQNWEPSPGDTATITHPDSPGCDSYTTYHQYMKAAKAKDEAGKRELVNRKWVALIPDGTSVLVIKRYKPKPIFTSRTMSGADFQRQRQNDLLESGSDSGPDAEIYPLEVRVTDGPHKGLAVFVPEPHVQRLIPKPPPMPPKDAKATAKPKPAPKPIDPAVRAESLVRQAKSLEASNPKAAVAYYRQVVKDYPTTPAAKTAAQRLKALGK